LEELWLRKNRGSLGEKGRQTMFDDEIPQFNAQFEQFRKETNGIMTQGQKLATLKANMKKQLP